MSRFNITNNLISFNQHNSQNKTPLIINHLKSGESIALVSDAGMPTICDPGENLIKDVKSNGLDIVCVPGPSAALTALVSSGFPSSKFSFEGFLPKKKSERAKILLEVCKNEKTTIIFESPHRLMNLLIELEEHCGGEREIQVSRELTKKFEENISSNVKEVIDFFEEKKICGEITVVIKGKSKSSQRSEFDKFEVKKELHDLVNAGLSLSAASKYLAKKYNLTKGKIYNLY